MKRPTCLEIAVLICLVALGAVSRILFQELPNFAPVAALALFSGYFFRSWLVAVAVPLAVMAISDFYIGGYEPGLMVVVYGSLALPVALRGLLRSRVRLANSSLGAYAASAAGLLTCALAGSLFFYVVSNFAWWIVGSASERSIASLLQNYAQALPFFRFTLAGDLLFTALLFGGYAVALNLGLAREPVRAVTQE